MKALYLDILSRLGIITDFQFTDIWNDQYQDQLDGKTYSFLLPACLIEIINEQPAKQLGVGVQIFDPILIHFHIIHELIDAGDGTMERNVAIFDLKDKIYQAFTKFKTPNAKCVRFIRAGEDQDYKHSNVYHFTVNFRTNLIDTLSQEPVNGVPSIAPLPLEADVTISPTNDPSDNPHIYNLLP